MSKMQNRLTNAIVVTGRRSTNGSTSSSAMDNNATTPAIRGFKTDGDIEKIAGSKGSITTSKKSSRNFLLENDFTYIDADDDHRSSCHHSDDDHLGKSEEIAKKNKLLGDVGDLSTSNCLNEGGGVDNGSNVANDVILRNESQPRGATIKVTSATNLNKNQSEIIGSNNNGIGGSVVTKATINYKSINNNNNELSCDNIKCNENCRSLTTTTTPSPSSSPATSDTVFVVSGGAGVEADRREIVATSSLPTKPQSEIDTENNGNDDSIDSNCNENWSHRTNLNKVTVPRFQQRSLICMGTSFSLLFSVSSFLDSRTRCILLVKCIELPWENLYTNWKNYDLFVILLLNSA